tara:strand:- start:279 stop:482 length:204 start_codon:yes stop_codon:yes gene_type:complete
MDDCTNSRAATNIKHAVLKKDFIKYFLLYIISQIINKKAEKKAALLIHKNKGRKVAEINIKKTKSLY